MLARHVGVSRSVRICTQVFGIFRQFCICNPRKAKFEPFFHEKHGLSSYVNQNVKFISCEKANDF